MSESSATQPNAEEKLFLTIDTAVIAGAGLLTGLVTLLAPLGVWFGWWNFGRGFELLQITNPYADELAWLILLGAVGLHVVARDKGASNRKTLLTVALVGWFAAYISYTIPQTFAPAAGTPPIHDITTDTENVPQFVDIAPLRADAPNTMVYGGSEGMTPQRLRELQVEAYPDIHPQTYVESTQAIFDRALAAAEQLGWEIVAAVPEEGRIEATDTTFWFRFKDDIVIYIAEQDGNTVVNARSLSRVGRSDVGKNAERLRQFFRTL